MPKSHLFVLDPLASLNVPLDSSLRMALALAALGHEIYACEPRELGWSSADPSAHAHCHRLRFGGDVTQLDVAPAGRRLLGDFSAIHMRKDPPYDLEYIATTWLLSSAGRATRVYNAPDALRRFNEKLSILEFRDDMQPALVTSDPEALFAFLQSRGRSKSGEDLGLVVKPLTLFGGRGVERVLLGQDNGVAARVALRKITEEGRAMRLAQPFDPRIHDGEVRVFTAFGEPLAWCLKKPAPGNYLANTRAGAKLSPYEPTAVELERVRRVATQMAKHGVELIGFDLIGGYLSELNITSPRLLLAPGDAAPNPYARFAALVDADLAKPRPA
jgi:glutathione synthase